MIRCHHEPDGAFALPFVRHALGSLHENFYNLSDSAMEDVLYEMEFVLHFAGLKPDHLPDETTILKFRHFLEHSSIGKV